MHSFLRAFRATLAVSLVSSAALYGIWSRHWPLVGDASLIHYIAFLIEHGKAPYRELGDMNMPGSFLIEMAAMKIFGGGALGWRVFDFTLLALAAIAFTTLTRRAGWLAALFASALFALVHGRDGLAQGGQRDLTMAVLLVLSTAALLLAIRRRTAWPMLAFGLLAGVALTIKPTALPLSLAQFGIALYPLRRRSNPGRPSYVLYAAAGLAAGPLIALAFLLQQHALAAFRAGLHGIVPYYAGLGHRPFGYLLQHSISPLMAPVLLWLAVLALARPKLDRERGLLLAGVLFGLASYVVQARGLPYYRYPLLAFLLPLLALDLVEALRLLAAIPLRQRLAALLALLALGIGGLFLAPQSAWMLHHYRWWQTDFISTLEDNLNRLGGPELSGRIQCIDSISGCGTSLYNLRLVQSSGVLSDFLLFGPPEVPVIARTRQELMRTLDRTPPHVIVVSSWLHLDGPGEYRKLERWPAFQSVLERDYRLELEWAPTRTQRWWSREELGAGYRIYVLRTEVRP